MRFEVEVVPLRNFVCYNGATQVAYATSYIVCPCCTARVDLNPYLNYMVRYRGCHCALVVLHAH